MTKRFATAFVATLAVAALAPATASARPGGISAAASVHLLPVGSFEVDIPGLGSDSESTKFAYGLAGNIDYQVNDSIAISFAPRYILNVITSSADADSDPASELDLMVRGAYGKAVNPKLTAYGFVGLGYSVIMPPSSASDDAESSKGPALGLGGGVRHGLSGSMFLQGELGYQLGFQKISEGGQTATVATNYLHLGVGIGSHF
jgi:opacity protein-like surface antigen